MDFDYRSTDFEALGLPTHSPFHWQQYKPVPVLTQKEQRALATAQRNREGAAARKKREREKLKATRVNPENYVCKPHVANSTLARR